MFLKEFQIIVTIILIIYCFSKFEDMRGIGTRAITSFFKKQPELDQSKAGVGCFDFL